MQDNQNQMGQGPSQADRQREYTKNPTETRKVYDNIHNFIYFPQYVWDFIDTPVFQRLRKIKQTSCLQYVFPGTTHSRFEHSLGTAHLALTFLKALIENNPRLYEGHDIESVKKTVTIAALVHDLGHGPYSHTFDSSIVTEITVKGKEGELKPIQWKHEIASEVLFTYLIEKYGLKRHFEKDSDIQRIKALVRGESDGIRPWQFELISNKINGIDVDKLDYFRRDAFHLGAKNIYIEHDLLFRQAKIIDNEICYPSKYVETVHNIFYSRYKLYKTYYQNIISKGVDLMICDILKAVDGKFNFRKICEQIYEDPTQYIKLNDNIIDKIEYIWENMKENPESEESKKHLKQFEKAVQIINRIRSRKLYKYVGQFHYFEREEKNIEQEGKNVEQEGKNVELVEFLRQEITQQKILDYISSKNSGFDRSLVSVAINEIGFGLKDANPLNRVGFFKKQEKIKRINKKEIGRWSLLYTDAYVECSVKIFIKINNQKMSSEVNMEFQNFKKDLNIRCKLKYGNGQVLNEGSIGTPFKSTEESEPIGYTHSQMPQLI